MVYSNDHLFDLFILNLLWKLFKGTGKGSSKKAKNHNKLLVNWLNYTSFCTKMLDKQYSNAP